MKQYDISKNQMTILKYVGIAIIVIILLAFVFPNIWKKIKNMFNHGTLALTTNYDENDKINATTIQAQMNSGWYGWTEDEEGIYGTIHLYTEQTYPKLKLAYFDLFNDDLTAKLHDLLNEEEFSHIAGIVS